VAYDPKAFPKRNDVYEFARRASKNLRFVIDAEANGEDVHPITQVICCLTGIAVFPWEDGLQVFNKTLSISDAFKEQNIEFMVREGEIKDFGSLLRAVRNSVSHRGIWFDSDSRKLCEVSITLTERWKKGGKKRTVLEFKGDQLAAFCEGVLEHACRSTG